MLNYLGQLRLYSLVDLILLLTAVRATPHEFIGAILLHIGFLAFLESKHRHSYRKIIPSYFFIISIIAGLLLFGHFEGLLFLFFSYLYANKNQKPFSLYSPIMRGLQCFFLIAGIIGYHNNFIWIVFALITLRNFCGDLRDAVKDKAENMKTLPVALGLTNNIKYIHLIAILITTFVWFSYTDLPILLLVSIFLVELLSYDLTPR